MLSIYIPLLMNSIEHFYAFMGYLYVLFGEIAIKSFAYSENLPSCSSLGYHLIRSTLQFFYCVI